MKASIIVGACFLLIISLFLLFALVRPAHASVATPAGSDRAAAAHGVSGLPGPWLPYRVAWWCVAFRPYQGCGPYVVR